MEEALKIDISSYLSSQGIKPQRETSRSSYYYSPLPGRQDGHPSFVVNKATNRWVDYGVSKEADRILSLVCLMENCTLKEAVDILLKDKDSVKNFDKTKFKDDPKSPSVLITSVKNYFKSSHVKYIESRNLTLDVVKRYCKQVNVVFPNSGYAKKVHTFVGFKNNLGGYELRNQKLKISVSPKYYTIIGTKGDRYVFEGFINFLSYLVYNDIQKIDGIVIVLNSLTLFPWVYDILRSGGTNHLFLDNDMPADEQLLKLEKKEIPYVDHRSIYIMYNDLNKMLCNDPSL